MIVIEINGILNTQNSNFQEFIHFQLKIPKKKSSIDNVSIVVLSEVLIIVNLLIKLFISFFSSFLLFYSSCVFGWFVSLWYSISLKSPEFERRKKKVKRFCFNFNCGGNNLLFSYAFHSLLLLNQKKTTFKHTEKC